MTEREALKLALEFIIASNQRSEFWLVPSSNLNKTVTSIREALAQPELTIDGLTPTEFALRELYEFQEATGCDTAAEFKAQTEQEPVAWLHTKIEGVAVPHRPADLDKHPDRWEALYKTPPPCPMCEALARTIMLDQTYHDAQRTWVGLTDEEIGRIAGDSLDAWSCARAIEAAHQIFEDKK